MRNHSADDSAIWQLEANNAELNTSLLKAQVDLRNPWRGIHNLTVLEGSVLGIATSDNSVGENTNVDEAFVRGADLVATYRETNDRPFSLQVYWRVLPCERGVVIIDTLLSLQTPLLESFPRVLVESRLASDEVWVVPNHGSPAKLTDSKGRDCIVLRSAGDWSYAEMTHPEDPCDWQIECSSRSVVQRELGGAFLEKGVIRRLRLRGIFLPRKGDLELAAQYQAELAAEAPPLTA